MYKWAVTTGSASSSSSDPQTVVDWCGPGAYKYPMVAGVAGLLGGLLGLGGGVVMSPVLLEIGMHSEAVQATTAMFVLISSSLASVQYAMLGRFEDTWTVACYCGLALVGTLAGQWFCEVFVRRRRRFSLITFAITGILLSSFVALLVIGVVQVWHEFSEGNYEAFKFHFGKVCGESDGILSMYETDSFETFGNRKPRIPVREYPVPIVHPR